MHGSKGHQASDAGEKPDRDEVVLNLGTVQRMLPLVRRIIDDFCKSQLALARLEPEVEILDRKRRTLDWPARQRRYRLREEVAQAENGLEAAREELDELGLVVLDAQSARIGFPTMVNNRKAYFSWEPGDDCLHSWHFADEAQCRPIPPAWLEEIAVSASR